MSKENIGGETSYEHTLAEFIADEDDRYQRFLANLLKGEIETDE